MKKFLFRLMIVFLWIVGPAIMMAPFIVDWFSELVDDYYPTSWKAFKKGSKV